ncbi:MAG TPA: hypothetical protein VHT24_00980 [Pseudacidobacterium sp.]|nr:hypothetical protein [Pseudacidobacterium sp.]
MSAETIIFIFGCLLLLIALVGGGFEAKEVKMPLVSSGKRLLCAAMGFVFIAIGLWLEFNRHPADKVEAEQNPSTERKATDVAEPQTPPPGQSASSAVQVRILDYLVTGQTKETVRVLFDGKTVAQFHLDENEDSEYADVTIPHEGLYNYEIDGDTIYTDSNGSFDFAGTGSGVIELKKCREH